MQFTALKTFFCDETQSEYVEGLSYTIRSPYQYDDAKSKARCNALAKLVPKWAAAGQVRLGGGDGGQVRGG